MATASQVLDEYILTTRLDDGLTAGATSAERALNRLEAQAQAAAAAIGDAGQATDAAGQRITSAASTFDRFANRVDDVSRAQNALARAQQQLQQAQAAANREMEAGAADYDRINRTLGELADRVETAAQKLGEARATAEANAEATAAWNFVLGQGSQAMENYATRVANSTQASKEAQASAQNAAAAQAQFNSLLGVNTTGGGYKDAASSAAVLGTELDKLRSKYDPLFRSSKDYEAALNGIIEAQKLGAISATAAEAATLRVNDAFARGKDVYAAATGTLKEATSAHDHFSLASAGATRELLVLGHEVVSGNFSRIPGSLIVMAERAGGLQTIIGKVGETVTSTGGLFAIAGVVAAGALAAMAVETEHSQARLLTLGQQLRATHDDYAALATQVDASARAVAASTSATTKDALVAAQTLASAKYYSGTAADMDVLLRKAVDLSTVMGTDLAKSSEFLKAAMNDTGAAAKQAAEQGFTGFTAEVVRTIQVLQEGGHYSDALRLYLDTLGHSADGANRQSMTPFRQATHDLGEAFYGARDGGKSFADVIGGPVLQALTSAINSVTAFIQALKSLPGYVKNIGTIAQEAVQFDLDGNPVPLTAEQRASRATSAAASVPSSSVQASPGATAVATEIATILRTQFQASDSAIAGMLGNAFKESGLNPAASVIDSNGLPSVGLFQHNGTRAAALAASAGVATGDQASVSQQVAYTMSEIMKDPSLKAMWVQMQTQAPAVAADNFNRTFERPADPTKTSAIAGAAANQFASPGGVIAGLPTIPSGLLNDARALDDTMGKVTENARAFTDVKLAAELGATGQKMGDLINLGQQDSDQFKALTQHAQALTAERYRNVDAVTAQNRADDSSLRATAGVFAGEQALNAEMEKRRQLALNSGTPFGSAEEAAALSQTLAVQSQQYEKVTTQIGMATASSKEMSSAYDSGKQKVIDSTATQKAYEEALKQFAPNTRQFGDAFREQIGLYKQQAQAAAEAQTAQQNAQSRDNLTYIQAETSTLGMNEDARTRLLTVMKAEQDMHTRFGDTLPKEAQDYIDLAGRTADATAAFQRQQNTLNELSGFFTNTFDTISNSITQAYATGGIQAVKFGDIAKSVANAVLSEFIKLAAINPLKNALFGTTSPDLNSVGGLLGGALGTGSAAAGTAAGDVNLTGAFDGAGTSTNAAGNLPTTSSLDSISSAASLAGTANTLSGGGILSGIGKLFGGGSSESFDTGGISTGISGLLGNGVVSAASAGSATNVALSGLGAGVYGPASTTAVNAAGIASSLGFGPETAAAISGATSSLASYVPYIGAGIGTLTDLAKGNYVGAATTAAGAAIGSIIPGVGTALGAVAGGLLGSLFGGAHPKNPYEEVQLVAQNGQLAEGKVTSQVEDPTNAKNSVSGFVSAVNDYLGQAKLSIAQQDGGVIGAVGDMFKNTANPDVANVSDLFSRLRFKLDGSNDPVSNYGIAASADLAGKPFTDPTALQSELVKIATFTDGLDAMGIKLESIGKDLTAIQIASVAAAGPGASANATQLSTALQHDLPGQTFASTDALTAEINKVNQFVNGTLPSLLNPVANTSSQLQLQIQATVKTYQDAIYQAKQYGLATDDLTAAQQKAIELLQGPARDALTQSELALTLRNQQATGQDTTATQLAQFDASAVAQRKALVDSFKNVYGDLGVVQQEYGQQAKTLDETLAAERLTLQKQLSAAMVQAEQQRVQAVRAAGDAQDSVNTAFDSIRARQATLNGDPGGAALINFDDQAAQEQKTYARQLVDFYGDSFYQSQDYQHRMSELTTVQEGERLAIVKQYGGQITGVVQATAAQIASAQSNVGNVITSLTTYAQGLQTGASSPLSVTSQYDLAKSQFQAVQGAAGAGDYTSTQELQGYSQAFLNASRAANGSGAAYAADFNRVLDAIQAVAAAPSDALTNSALLAATQSQTATLSGKFDELKAELVAVRKELQQQARAA